VTFWKPVNETAVGAAEKVNGKQPAVAGCTTSTLSVKNLGKCVVDFLLVLIDLFR